MNSYSEQCKKDESPSKPAAQVGMLGYLVEDISKRDALVTEGISAEALKMHEVCIGTTRVR